MLSAAGSGGECAVTTGSGGSGIPDERKLTAARLTDLKASTASMALTCSYMDFPESLGRLAVSTTAKVIRLCREKGLEVQVKKSEVEQRKLGVEFRGDMDFRFDVRRDLLGMVFDGAKVTDELIHVAKGYLKHVIAALEDQVIPENVTGFAFGVQHLFFLVGQGRKNRHIVHEKLIQDLGSGSGVYSGLVSSVDEIGRVDLKFSFQDGDDRIVYVTLQCPGNEGYTVVDATLAYQFDVDHTLEAVDLKGYFTGIVDSGYDFYRTKYAAFLENVLGAEELDLRRTEL